MKPLAILLLSSLLSIAQEGDFKEVKDPDGKESKQEQAKQGEGDFKEVDGPDGKDAGDKKRLQPETRKPDRKVGVKLPSVDYPVRNIGKSDPRFQAIHQEIQNDHPGLTLDQLYSRLLAGETFTIERQAKPATCKECNGFGKVPDKSSGYRSKDGKTICPTCRGTGKVEAIQVILVKW